MPRVVVTSTILWASVFAFVHTSPRQNPAAPAAGTVDYVRDVQPIFQQHCVECHGPDRQSNGFRLDRRRDALAGGSETVLVPGSAATSRLYLRLLGQYAEPMPKDSRLDPADIATIKAWIDQGTVWPDAVSGDPPARRADAAVDRARKALRAGDTRAMLAMARTDPQLGGRRGADGTSLLMESTLYGPASLVEAMLKSGGDPNAANDAGATALMWGVTDLQITRALVAHGADVNARSQDGRTALLAAAGIPGALDVVRLLLDAGATPNIKAAGSGLVTPLSEAARIGDAERMALLLRSGAKIEAAGPDALAMAIRAQCAACVTLLLPADAPRDYVTAAVAIVSPPLGPGLATPLLVAHGAQTTAMDPMTGLNGLMVTAASEALPVDVAAQMIAQGADVNAVGRGGVTALSLAARHGNTAMVDLLRRSGAVAHGPLAETVPPAAPAETTAAAIRRSLPLLQRTDETFSRKAGCLSCHNNVLAASTVSLARSRGVNLNEAVASAQRARLASYLDSWRDRVLLGHGVPGDEDTISYLLTGLVAERYPADATTDAMARYLRLRQRTDGHWAIFAHRPPIEVSDVQVTAVAARALQYYAPPADAARTHDAVMRAARWLRTAPVTTTEDRAFQILGLAWLGQRASLPAAVHALVAAQRPDGGWSQLATLESDAYATGEALVALAQGSAIGADDPVVQRGAAFLRRTQRADGSWFVATRAIPLQPYFDAGFPYGSNQFISAAATNWATQALLLTTAAPRPVRR